MATPMIAYEDGPAAMDWLVRAFGFLEKLRMMHEGRLAHGEPDTATAW
jgi:PhnB protein